MIQDLRLKAASVAAQGAIHLTEGFVWNCDETWSLVQKCSFCPAAEVYHPSGPCKLHGHMLKILTTVTDSSGIEPLAIAVASDCRASLSVELERTKTTFLNEA